MIRRSPHIEKVNRFSRLTAQRHSSFAAAVREEADNVVIKPLKGALLVDDLRVKILSSSRESIVSAWTTALFETAPNQWPALAWRDDAGGWVIALSITRLDSSARGGLGHFVTMNLSTFGVWLRANQW